MKKILKGAILGLAISSIPLTGSASNLKFVKPIEGDNPVNVKISSPTSLSGDLKGFSWVEMYNSGSFYGESNFGKKLGKNLSTKAQLNHPNELAGRLSLGIGLNVPWLPDNTSLKLTAFPLVYDVGDDRMDRLEVNYSASIELPYDVKASSFGEVDLVAENGPTWGYGEISISKEINGLEFSYNPALRSKGNLRPTLENRIAMSTSF